MVLWRRKKTNHQSPWWVRACISFAWWCGVRDPKERAERRAAIEDYMADYVEQYEQEHQEELWQSRGGYSSSARRVEDLDPPPAGPAPGV